MAKYKKKYYKKKVLSAIGKYSRRKLHYVFTIQWNNGTLLVDGEQKQSLTLFDAVQGNTAEYQTLGKQFAQIKLRGVLIEAVSNSFGQGFNVGLCLGQANDVSTFGNVRTQPNVMILGEYVKNRMYVPISGSFTSTNSIELFNNMKIIPFSEGNANCRFTVRLTLYCTFKTSL